MESVNKTAKMARNPKLDRAWPKGNPATPILLKKKAKNHSY